MKEMDADMMLSTLIENKLVGKGRNVWLKDWIGEFNYLGALHHYGDRKGLGKWDPQAPSIPQLRQLLTIYAVLPLGDPDVKATMTKETNIRSILLYGPEGSGKTFIVEALANEIGALLITLNPKKLLGLFPGKQGPTKLVHMIFMVGIYPFKTNYFGNLHQNCNSRF